MGKEILILEEAFEKKKLDKISVAYILVTGTTIVCIELLLMLLVTLIF